MQRLAHPGHGTEERVVLPQGVLAYAVPVCLLQATLTRDRLLALAFAPYTAWLIGYDVPWTYRLWQLNP